MSKSKQIYNCMVQLEIFNREIFLFCWAEARNPCSLKNRLERMMGIDGWIPGLGLGIKLSFEWFFSFEKFARVLLFFNSSV